MWDLWFHGNLQKKIQPYKRIKGAWDLVKSDRTALSNISFILNRLENMARAKGLVGDKASITEFSKRESDLIFSQVYTDLMNLLKNRIKTVRVEDIAYMTIYNMIKSMISH